MLLVRPAESRDFQVIRDLRESASGLPDARDPSAARIRFLAADAVHFDANLADPAEMWIVADAGAGVIAWIHAVVRSDSRGPLSPRFVEIVMVFVLLSERRHGVALALLAAVELLTRGLHIGLLRLVVHATNTGAIRMYEGLGYLARQGMMEKTLGA